MVVVGGYVPRRNKNCTRLGAAVCVQQFSGAPRKKRQPDGVTCTSQECVHACLVSLLAKRWPCACYMSEIVITPYDTGQPLALAVDPPDASRAPPSGRWSA